MGDADPAVCKCGRTMTVDEERLGGAIFHVIVPMYRGSLCHKAGYVHKYQNVPAEKTYVQVPAAKKN